MSASFSPAKEALRILEKLGAHSAVGAAGGLNVCSPIDGLPIASVQVADAAAARDIIAAARRAFIEWRDVPAPRRGELIRLFGEELRAAKEDLGHLVTIETGKIRSEGLGEVQEMIDICEYAVGLSRQLYGLTMATERRNHRMMEAWHPVGVVGVISAFNFPVAVWSWNAALALVCGNSVVWKPSEKTPLSALAAQSLFERAAARMNDAPAHLSTVLVGGRDIGEILVDDDRVSVVAATGSTAMGRLVGPRVAGRFGRSILELGGNNAAIVCPSADLDLALRAIAFAAMGTVGQRCTSLRRLFVHESVADIFLPRLKKVYESVAVGDPRDARTLIGPLHSEASFHAMQRALSEARKADWKVYGGQRVTVAELRNAFYVYPALVEVTEQTGLMKQETFAPILYVKAYRDLDEAIRLHNDVPQGLSSSIFTNDLREAERFLSAAGSDCGIANVNIGTSGGEIGGAFGGEKETGGGREGGTDSWKGYMRRATNTINYGRELPLAQGIKFDVL